jgi:hypothetical protein
MQAARCSLRWLRRRADESVVDAAWGTREPRSGHNPGRVVRDLAEMLADVAGAWLILGRSLIRSRCLGGPRRTRRRFA